MDIEVNGIKIHYEMFGKGKPIILLNPNSANTNCMKFIAHKLAKQYLVYQFDRRGCGKSEKNCVLSYEESAEDVYEFIQNLNLEKPYVLGSSGGATVAMHLGIRYPESISKMVLCSGVARSNRIQFPSYVKLLSQLPWYPGKKSVDRFFTLVRNAEKLEPQELRKIQVPTLVVNGGNKDIVPKEEAKYLAECIPDSQLLILEKENHFSYVMNMKWYDTLREFLEK